MQRNVRIRNCWKLHTKGTVCQMKMNRAELLNAGCGRQLTSLSRAGKTMTILLSEAEALPSEYAIHIQTNAKILLDGILLTSTDDIDADQPYGEGIYDRKVTKLLTDGNQYTVKSIQVDEKFCIKLRFDNGLEIFSCPEEEPPSPQDELWRVFLVWYAGPYLTGYVDRIEMEEAEVSQERLDAIRRDMELLRKRKHDNLRKPNPQGARP